MRIIVVHIIIVHIYCINYIEFVIAHKYYYVELDNECMILYSLGQKLNGVQPTQGHEFIKRQK